MYKILEDFKLFILLSSIVSTAMKLSAATSPKSCLVAIHVQPREANPNRLIIKCNDSHVSVGSLKFTLSANSNAKSFAGTHVTKLPFTSTFLYKLVN